MIYVTRLKFPVFFFLLAIQTRFFILRLLMTAFCCMTLSIPRLMVVKQLSTLKSIFFWDMTPL
jgi:hypothetical protein